MLSAASGVVESLLWRGLGETCLDVSSAGQPGCEAGGWGMKCRGPCAANHSPGPIFHPGTTSSQQLRPSRRRTPLCDSYWGGFPFSPSSLFFPSVPKEGGLIKKKKKKKYNHKLKARQRGKASSLRRGAGSRVPSWNAEHPSWNAEHPDTRASSLLQMTEGRRCQVHLLDDRKLELLVQVGAARFTMP